MKSHSPAVKSLVNRASLQSRIKVGPRHHHGPLSSMASASNPGRKIIAPRKQRDIRPDNQPMDMKLGSACICPSTVVNCHSRHSTSASESRVPWPQHHPFRAPDPARSIEKRRPIQIASKSFGATVPTKYSAPAVVEVVFSGRKIATLAPQPPVAQTFWRSAWQPCHQPRPLLPAVRRSRDAPAPIHQLQQHIPRRRQRSERIGGLVFLPTDAPSRPPAPARLSRCRTIPGVSLARTGG